MSATKSASSSIDLETQQDLVNARVALVTAQRDRVVASYTVLAAVYDPVVHYQACAQDPWPYTMIE
jgi:outer membrane protein